MVSFLDDFELPKGLPTPVSIIKQQNIKKHKLDHYYQLNDRQTQLELQNAYDSLDLFSDENEAEYKVKTISTLRRELSWLYGAIDKANAAGVKLGVTSNAMQMGRFYTFHYVPKSLHFENKKTIPFYDARPIIFCLDANYRTHYFKKQSNDIGFLGINLHYMPITKRRAFVKTLLGFDSRRKNYPNWRNGRPYKPTQNQMNFISNRPLTVNPRLMKLIADQSHNELHQYLYGGRYVVPDYDAYESDNPVKSVTCGAFKMLQIPYSNLPEILNIPSIYDVKWGNY